MPTATATAGKGAAVNVSATVQPGTRTSTVSVDDKGKDLGQRHTLVMSREDMDRAGAELVGVHETPRYQVVLGYMGIVLAAVGGLVFLLFMLYTKML
jgi:hypothetical protein